MTTAKEGNIPNAKKGIGGTTCGTQNSESFASD
jgi:hypothetical protein